MKTKYIRRVLLYLAAFVANQRGSGTTTLIKKIASENDVWVLVYDQKQKKQFGDSAITLGELANMDGYNSKPILIDNHALLELASTSDEEFKRLDSLIERRNKLIKTIRDEIDKFEQTGGKYILENDDPNEFYYNHEAQNIFNK